MVCLLQFKARMTPILANTVGRRAPRRFTLAGLQKLYRPRVLFAPGGYNRREHAA